MKVNGKDDIPYMMENKKWSKPPTSWFSDTNRLVAAWSNDKGKNADVDHDEKPWTLAVAYVFVFLWWENGPWDNVINI